LGTGSTSDCLYYIWSCYAQALSKLDGRNTKYFFLRLLAWSVRWLWLGRWPTHDVNGQPYPEDSAPWKLAHETYYLADGFCGMFFAFIADLDHQTKFWEIENYESKTNPCYYCPCNLTSMNWRDFRTTARWVTNVYTHQQWCNRHPDRLYILKMQMFSVFTICTDWMHVKYLGTDQYFFGSVLFYMVSIMMLGFGTPESNMLFIMTRIRESYADDGVQCCFKTITVRMFASKACKQITNLKAGFY
jgi:hypothetical protein